MKLVGPPLLLLLILIKPIPVLAGDCDGIGAPSLGVAKVTGNTITFFFTWPGRGCSDFMQFRWGIVGRNLDQMKFTGSCPPPPSPGSYCEVPQRLTISPDEPNVFMLQACKNEPLQPASCTPWGQLYYLPYGLSTCQNSFVWREAFPGDHVCVTPPNKQQAAKDNASAAERVCPKGSDVCCQKYVWRQAVPADHVCVDVPTRTETQKDNGLAHSRLARTDDSFPAFCSITPFDPFATCPP